MPAASAGVAPQEAVERCSREGGIRAVVDHGRDDVVEFRAGQERAGALHQQHDGEVPGPIAVEGLDGMLHGGLAAGDVGGQLCRTAHDDGAGGGRCVGDPVVVGGDGDGGHPGRLPRSPDGARDQRHATHLREVLARHALGATAGRDHDQHVAVHSAASFRSAGATTFAPWRYMVRALLRTAVRSAPGRPSPSSRAARPHGRRRRPAGRAGAPGRWPSCRRAAAAAAGPPAAPRPVRAGGRPTCRDRGVGPSARRPGARLRRRGRRRRRGSPSRGSRRCRAIPWMPKSVSRAVGTPRWIASAAAVELTVTSRSVWLSTVPMSPTETLRFGGQSAPRRRSRSS